MKSFKIQYVLISSLALCISANALAQGKLQDVIYLNNGSIVRGKTVPTQSEGKIAIRTADKSLWVFTSDEVKRISREKAPVIEPIGRGIYNIIEVGVYSGRNEQTTRLYPSLQVINGFQFDDRVAMGLGLGIENFGNMGYLPVFAESRFFIFKNALSPYLSGRAGWSFPLRNQFIDGNRQYYGGISMGASLGFRRYIKDKFGLQTSVGYNYQQTKEESPWWWGQGKTTTYSRYNSLEIRLGFLFR